MARHDCNLCRLRYLRYRARRGPPCRRALHGMDRPGPRRRDGTGSSVADEQGTLVRSAVRVAIPWARSVIVCAMNYNAAAPYSTAPASPDAGWIARYAWSGSGGKTCGLPRRSPRPPPRRRVCPQGPRRVREPLLRRYRTPRRTHRRRAGGASAGSARTPASSGRATGSWLLMGVIVTSLSLNQAPSLEPDRCGSCTRCLDACPTGALVAPREMDASLCIAYLSIEKKGAIPEPLRAPMGRQIFGCDICQDVCPWNRKAPIAIQPALQTPHRARQPRPRLAGHAGFCRLPSSLQGLAARAHRQKASAPQRGHRHGQLRRPAVRPSTRGLGRGGRPDPGRRSRLGAPASTRPLRASASI